MSAPTKDDVYAELRRQGIRPIRVEERIAPIVRKGFSGLRKRDWALIAAIVAVLLVALYFVLSGSDDALAPADGQAPRKAAISVDGNVEAHPTYLRLALEVESLLEHHRQAMADIDIDLLNNYALIERSPDMSEFRAEVSKARSFIASARGQAKALFSTRYVDIPEDCSTDRINAQMLYGIFMNELDAEEERISLDECALDLLEANRGAWRTVKGRVKWDSEELEQAFSLCKRDDGEGVARWQRDFGKDAE